MKREDLNGGYMRKVINVDLATGEIWEECLEEKLLRDFVGGYGVGARILFSRQKAGVDPLGPDNTLGFVTGPLTGTPIPFGNRYQVVAKSPLTGTWGDAASGGDFGPRLKFAGCDYVFFTGISEKPVYLLIDEGRAELRDGSHLWGRDTFETEDILKAELGKEIGVACIGPSGEKLSLISCVMNNKGRAAGRSGLGAVMGSKRLKAVVARGNLKVPLADEARTREVRRKLLAKMTKPFVGMCRKYGQSGLVRSIARAGGLPVRNYAGINTIEFPDAWETIGGPAVVAYQDKPEGCWRCPMACSGRMRAGTGEYQWEAGALKPEYEGVAAFGSRCGNRNMESIIKACDICNRYGVDHCSAGAAISFAIECYENGLIGLEDTGSVELTWGNHRSMVTMTEMLAKMEGFGAILADGVRLASEKIGKGSDKYALHVHGQEIDCSDPRPWPGWALSYVTNATPARHTQGSNYYVECGADPPFGFGLEKLEPFVYSGKGESERRMEAVHHMQNVLGVCMFGTYAGALDAEGMIESIKAVVGWDISVDKMLGISDRVSAIRQAFTIREGVNPVTDFKMPERLLTSVSEGPLAGVKLDVDAMVKEYYSAVEWEQSTAKPSKSRLEQLGLKDVAEVLWP